MSKKYVPLAWFWFVLKRYIPLYGELIVIVACSRLLALVEPFIFQTIIDKILPFQREASLTVVTVFFAIATAFVIIFAVLNEYLKMSTANSVTSELGNRAFNHLFGLPLSFFQKYRVGEIIARISEIDAIRGYLVGTSITVILDLTFVVFYILILFQLSETLTWFVLLTMPIQAAVYFCFGPFLRANLRRSFDAGASHNSRLVEAVNNALTVKSLGLRNSTTQNLKQSLNKSLNASFRVGVLKISSQQVIFAINEGLTIAIIFFGAISVFENQMTLGELIAFHMISSRTLGPVRNFSGLWEGWLNLGVSRQRLGNIITETSDSQCSKPQMPNNGVGSLVVRNLEFGHIPGAPVFKSVNFNFDAHTLNLIVGSSGCGKSTLGKLICALEKPDDGEILFRGHNINDFNAESVRNQLLYSEQQPQLFNGTLRENLNIRSTPISIPDNEIWDALNMACATDFVKQMPDGLDTQVGDICRAPAGALQISPGRRNGGTSFRRSTSTHWHCQGHIDQTKDSCSG